MADVYSSLRLRSGLTLKNRLVLAPMTTYSSYPDGNLRESEEPYLESRSEGLGATMTAACYVHKSGHAFEGQWACSGDAFLPSLARGAEAIHRGGAAAILQIHHGGRQSPSRLCGRSVSASAIPSERPNAEVPAELTNAEIEELIAAFAKAAGRAKAAGYDGVEIHGANTYLLQQFVSPHSNRRTDRWGQDRTAFSVAVTEAVLAEVGPRFAVGYRFSPEEVETPGIRMADTEALLERLCNLPLDWLHISLGDFRQSSLNKEFEEPTLTRVLRAIDGRVPLIGVGSVKTVTDAQACLDMGAEMVAVGRAAITERDWGRRALTGETPRLKFPRQGAAEMLTLPEGLVNRILNAPGWFELEDEAVTSEP